MACKVPSKNFKLQSTKSANEVAVSHVNAALFFLFLSVFFLLFLFFLFLLLLLLDSASCGSAVVVCCDGMMEAEEALPHHRFLNNEYLILKHGKKSVLAAHNPTLNVIERVKDTTVGDVDTDVVCE